MASQRWAVFAGLVIVVGALGVFRPAAPVAHAAAPTFPIRAAFYYPWFPEAWNQQQINPFTWYTPAPDGYYDSTAATVIDDHIMRMKYAHISAGIASWWGQGTATDRRIPLLLTEAHSRDFYWTLYYEPALSPTQLPSDLDYIYANYASDPNFLHVGGKPVLFIYTRSVMTCADVATWVTTNNNRFYLDPQVFAQYLLCPTQPDSWHQYAPTSATDKQHSFSFTISPGFWLRTDAAPRLVRDPVRWRTNVQAMVASDAQWQLITTFNEWGEGTAVEDATQWESCSGYGTYLDELHTNGTTRTVLCSSSTAPLPTRSPAAQSSPVPAPTWRSISSAAPAAPMGVARSATPKAPTPVTLSDADLAMIRTILASHPWRLMPR